MSTFAARFRTPWVIASLISATPAWGAKPATPAEPEKPPVPLKLTLSESGPEEPWKLVIENTSGHPVRLFDEPRALWLEVAATGGAKPKTCKLPEELFPKAPTVKSMKELAPGEAVRHHVDPRFYCFSSGAQEVLLPSAQVTPHYGFPSATKPSWKHGKSVNEKLRDVPPFVAEPKEDGDLGPAKNLSGDPIVLDARYAVWSEKPQKDEKEDELPSLEMVKGSDAQAEANVLATIRLRNPMHHKLVVYLRRELITFEVLTPRGTVSCDADDGTKNPDRRAFSSVAPGGSVTLVSRLVELCPRGTFASPGLYFVSARFDAAEAGADYGLEAFTGKIHTDRPVPVRVRRETQLVRNRVLKTAGGPPPPGGPVPVAAPIAVPPPPPAPPPPPQEAPPPPPPGP